MITISQECYGKYYSFECNALWDTVEMQYARFNTAHFRGSLRVVCYSKNSLNLNRTLNLKGERKI